MIEKHPLVEKALAKLPQNWREWLEQWNATSDSLALLSLLHHGPEMPGAAEYEGRTEASALYLRLAKNWQYNIQQFNEDPGFGETTNIFNCPRQTLAKAAFQVLCKYGFKKADPHGKPWEFFVYDGVLLDELLNFLDLNSLEVCSGEDGLHGLFCYAKERYKDILTEFCLGLATFLITLRLPEHIDDEEKTRLLALWRPRQKTAVKILWYLDKLNLLIERKETLEGSTLERLRELILYKDIVVPVSTRSLKDVRKKPKDVRDLLKIKPGGFFWHHGGGVPKRVEAAYLYLGLTATAS